MNNKRSEQKGVRYEDLNLPDFDLSFITPEYLGERKIAPSLVTQNNSKDTCLLHRSKCECTFAEGSMWFRKPLFYSQDTCDPKSFEIIRNWVPRKKFHINLDLNLYTPRFWERELEYLSKQNKNLTIPIIFTHTSNINNMLHILRI